MLELLQNADDNTYICETPQVRFTYGPGYFRMDCNEVGFTAENVRAISAICDSTKSGKNKLNRFTGDKGVSFIGEKGVGFKSVFRVADVVWIASGPYRFKFDKRETLGMIGPRWAEFPTAVTPEFTSFYFQLSEDYDQTELLQDLKDFDPERLLFLRHLETVQITIQSAVGGTLLTTKLYRTISQGLDIPVAIIHRGSEEFAYHMIKHLVTDLPEDAIKRPGLSESEIQLAFPVLETFDRSIPSNKSKNLFAYLPVGDYGLKVWVAC